MPDKIPQKDLYDLMEKIIFPAFLAVGLKLAIEMKKTNTKISIFNITLSMIIGVGGAYLSSGFIMKTCSEETIPVVIALIAITSEKIGEFIIYKLNVDLFLTAIFDGFFQYVSNVFNPKK